MIADNDHHVAVILAAFLRRGGCEVDVVEDGAAAADRIEGERFDLFVCDLDMPRLTGDALLEQLRGDPRLPPTIVISGFLDQQTQDRLEDHPCVREVLRKPFDVAALAGRVPGIVADSEHQKGPSSA